MLTETGDKQGAAAVKEADLIESIYKIALEPQSYDDFMEHWDEHIGSAIQRLQQLRNDTLPSEGAEPEPGIEPGLSPLAKHFETGFRLLEEMGRKSPAGYFDSDSGGGKATFLLDAMGRVVWFNGAAGKLFDLNRQTSAPALPVAPSARPVLDRAVAQLDAVVSGKAEDLPLNARSIIIRMIAREPEEKSVYMLAKITRDRFDQALLVLREAGPAWHPETDELLRSDFGLTGAEVETAKLLSEGLNLSEIAEQRGSALETVRKQVKTAMAKTGTRSQADFLRLILTLIRLAEREHPAPAAVTSSPAGLDMVLNGRRVPVEFYGPPDGRPVIFFHGMLDGCSMTTAMKAELMRRNLRIIAPVRPGFGEAARDNGPISEAPQRFAGDVKALLDQLNLQDVVFLGHMAGSVYAFATARQLEGRVRGIVNVAGGVPILSSSQFAVMSRRQRLVAYTARYTPALLPFILRAGIRQLDFGGEASFLASLYETSPRDKEALKDREAYESVCAGYHFSVSQGHEAFQTDAWHVVRDWSPLVDSSDVPVHLVHGCHDPVVSIQSARDFANRLGGRAQLTEAPDCGQLVLYKRPETVFSAVEGFLETLGADTLTV